MVSTAAGCALVAAVCALLAKVGFCSRSPSPICGCSASKSGESVSVEHGYQSRLGWRLAAVLLNLESGRKGF
jgi:hypothetical protein